MTGSRFAISCRVHEPPATVLARAPSTTQAGCVSSVWIESLHNLHCPTCDTPLVEQAGRYLVLDRPRPVYVGEVETLTCRDGHPLPSRADLYDYRDLRGIPAQAPVREVAAPR